MASTIPAFRRYATRQLDSISALVPVGHRCGVYVLAYPDGTRYVGQAVDVVRRYAQHRHVQGPIDSVDFGEVDENDLTDVEIAMIHHEGTTGQLRNRTYASEFVGKSVLDPVVTRDDQLSWLAGVEESDGTRTGARPDDAKQRAARRPRFDELVNHPFGAVAACLLAEHIRLTVPHARETERRFWSVSAMPSTNGGGRLATLSVGKAETLFLYPIFLGGDMYVGGRINVAASAVSPDVLDGSLDRPEAQIDPERGGYESTGNDLVGLRFIVTNEFDGYLEVMGWPGVLDAARLLTVRLMRKGVSLQGRWHNFALADVLLGDAPWPWSDAPT